MFASENDPLLGDGEQIIHLNEDLNNYSEIILPCKLVGSLKYQVQQGFSSDSNLWSNVILALMATVLFLKSILNEIPFAVGSTIMHQLEMDHSTWQYSQALIFVLLCIPGGMLIWNDRCRKFNVMIFVLSGVFMVSGCMLFVAGIQQKRIGFVFVGEFLSGFDDIWLLNGILALLNFTQSHVLPKTIFLTVSSRSGQIVSSYF